MVQYAVANPSFEQVLEVAEITGIRLVKRPVPRTRVAGDDSAHISRNGLDGWDLILTYEASDGKIGEVLGEGDRSGG